MFSHIGARLAAVLRTRAGRFAFRSAATVAATLAVVMLSGCAAPPIPAAKADPANAGAAVAPVSYRSATVSYRSMRPAEPAPWGPQNGAAAPTPKSNP